MDLYEAAEKYARGRLGPKSDEPTKYKGLYNAVYGATLETIYECFVDGALWARHNDNKTKEE